MSRFCRTIKSMLPSSAPRVWLLLRFGLVGVLNAAFGYAAFAFLVVAGVWPGVALIAANLAGIAFNFQTSRRLVFRTKGRGLRFAVLYCVMMALNWAGLRILQRVGLSALLAQALLVLPVAALSFLGQRLFVFHPAEEPA